MLLVSLTIMCWILSPTIVNKIRNAKQPIGMLIIPMERAANQAEAPAMNSFPKSFG